MKDGKKVTLIIDSSHHAMRIISVCRKEDTEEEGFQLFKYVFLQGIFDFIEQFNADEVIIALDSKKNWRKDFFPYYKGLRKIKRKQDEAKDQGWFSFSSYYEMYDEFITSITENLPFKVLEVHKAEADDIAGVLTQSEALKDNFKILVTADGDYVQLLQNDLTSVYNPIKRKFMDSPDPKKDLLRKIIQGDKGDHVPSIKDKHTFKDEFLQYCVKEGLAQNKDNAKIKLDSDEDLLLSTELKFHDEIGMKPSRVSVFPKKIMEGLLENNYLMQYLKENPEEKAKFLRNKKLVSLTDQPKELRREIINTYEDYELKSGINKLFDYFILNKFNDFMRNTTKIGNLLEPLCE